MGKAGKALRQVLETYNISQNQLAIVMGVSPANVSRWVNESHDPTAEAVVTIKEVLEELDWEVVSL
ncbi:MAG: helix-turn-helix domain-containing protein [Microcoleaceae cyanobacterium]